jgi:hypothetical protein
MSPKYGVGIPGDPTPEGPRTLQNKTNFDGTFSPPPIPGRSGTKSMSLLRESGPWPAND